jgi:hypothetical protein
MRDIFLGKVRSSSTKLADRELKELRWNKCDAS